MKALPFTLQDVVDAIKRGRGRRISFNTPEHGKGYFYFKMSRGTRYAQIEVDLWGIDYDLDKKVSKKITKEYEKYIKYMFKNGRKKVLYYGVDPKTYIRVEVFKEDTGKWIDFFVEVLSNPKNLQKINPLWHR